MTSSHFLVVEDEALIAMDIKLSLQECGVDDVTVCHNLPTALSALDGFAPDAAILDLNLGSDQTSVEVARKLKSHGTPFAFLTGYSDSTVNLPEDLSTAPRLQKPFNMAELNKAVEMLLRPTT